METKLNLSAHRGHPPAARARPAWLARPDASTYLDPLLRLGEGGFGGWLGLQGLERFQTESGTSHLQSPACTGAPGSLEEHGRRCSSSRSALLPAPSRPAGPPRRPAPSPRVSPGSGQELGLSPRERTSSPPSRVAPPTGDPGLPIPPQCASVTPALASRPERDLAAIPHVPAPGQAAPASRKCRVSGLRGSSCPGVHLRFDHPSQV